MAAGGGVCGRTARSRRRRYQRVIPANGARCGSGGRRFTARGLKEVLLWGHSSGAALAVETAKRLQRTGTNVRRVFLGAQLLGAAPDRRAAVAEIGERSNGEISARLSADSGYTELGELDAEHAEHVGAAYRHDYVSANRYFADVLDNPPSERLVAPVTVVVAADDAATPGFRVRHRDWGLLAQDVELHELADGGHHFPRTRSGGSCAGSAVVRRNVGFSIKKKKKLTVHLKGTCPPEVGTAICHPRASLSSLEVDLQPGKPPYRLRSRPPATRRAGRPSTGMRYAPSSPSTVRFWFAVSTCGTPPSPPTSSDGSSTSLMIEREAFAARQVYADGVYSSATWPANQPMCMHHELSYRLEVPSLMLFACLSAPTSGGATAVSDSPRCSRQCPRTWSGGSSGKAGC